MCAQKSCCEWLFSFFSRNTNQNRGGNSYQPPLTSNLNIHRDNNDASANENNYLNNQGNQEVPGANNNTFYINLPILKTNFELKDIVCHFIPDKSKDVRYNCPICLKFYNHILVLSCCKNYLCLPCLNNYIDTSKKYLSKIRCMICNCSDQLYLEDVDPKSQIRNYSDSIYASIKKTAGRDIELKLDSVTLKGPTFKIHKKKRIKYNSFDNGLFFNLDSKKLNNKHYEDTNANIAFLRKTYFNSVDDTQAEFKISLKPMKTEKNYKKKCKSEGKIILITSFDENKPSIKICSKIVSCDGSQNNEEKKVDIQLLNNKSNIINFLQNKIKEEQIKLEILNKELDTIVDNRTGHDIPTILEFREIIDFEQLNENIINIDSEQNQDNQGDQNEMKHRNYVDNSN